MVFFCGIDKRFGMGDNEHRQVEILAGKQKSGK